MTHETLDRAPSNLLGGEWAPIEGGALVSTNPARPAHVIWSGSPRVDHVSQAVDAARRALPAWSEWPRERRFEALRAYAALCRSREDEIASLISDETGKPLWDARTEAGALAAKVDITLDQSETAALRRVTGQEFELTGTRLGRSFFRPHGVMAVIGPFNFPAHLPNGHIVPALAMGNTVVLKPSDKTPAVGQLLASLLHEALTGAGAPAGAINLVQGGADVATALTTHGGIDGILFTGSWPVGRRIMEANLGRPGRMIALEMGGNNPAVIMPDADLKQAVIECVRAGFISTGQRCTCTRRVIVHEAVADRVIPAICKSASNLVVGDPKAQHPVFMGPIITDEARRGVIDAQQTFARQGGEVLVKSTPLDHPDGGWYLTPGVMQVERFIAEDSGEAGCDVEVFGPLLRVSVVGDLDEAIRQTNATKFGLAASLFTQDGEAVERFLREARAGCINVNTGTAGASSKLPFGGLGHSGNHRPAGAFSLDYCAYPVASMIERGEGAATPPGMTFEERWL